MKGGVDNLIDMEENIELRSLLINDELFQNKLLEFNSNENIIIFTFDGNENMNNFEKKFINSFNNTERIQFLTNDFPYPFFGGVYNYKYIVFSKLNQLIIYKSNTLDIILDYFRDNDYFITIEDTLRLVYKNSEDEFEKNLVELLYGRINDYITNNPLLSSVEKIIINNEPPTWNYEKLNDIVNYLVNQKDFNIYKSIFNDFDCKIIFTFNISKDKNYLSKIFIDLLDYERDFFLEQIGLDNINTYIDPNNNVIFYKEELLQELINIFISSNVKIPCVSETNYCSIERILDLIYNFKNKRQEHFSKILLGEINACVKIEEVFENKKSIDFNKLDKDFAFAYGNFVFDSGDFSDRSRAILQKREYLEEKKKSKKEIIDKKTKNLEKNMILPGIVSMMITLFMSILIIIFNNKKRY